MFTFDLKSDSDFQAVLEEVRTLRQEVADLRTQLPEWVDQVEAERLTGLSRATLYRLRRQPGTLIVWRSDRGIHYQRTSLIAHNNSRVITRRRAS